MEGPLSFEDRAKVKEKLWETILQTGRKDQIQMQEIVDKLEDSAFKQATNKQEYFQIIASKMYCVKNKNKTKISNASGSNNTLPESSNYAKDSPLNVGSIQMNNLGMSNLGTNDNLTNLNIGAMMKTTNISNVTPNMMDQIPNNLIQHQGMRPMTIHPSNLPTESHSLQQGSTEAFEIPPEERKYWEKHHSLQQYMRPLSAMRKQIDRLLEGYTGDQEKKSSNYPKEIGLYVQIVARDSKYQKTHKRIS